MDKARIDLGKLGHKVRFYRQGRGWTIATLAEKSGVSKAYISDLENGVAGKPNIQYVYGIAVALEVTLDELLEDAKPSSKYRPRKDGEELPPGLATLQQELKLSDAEVESLAQI
ncbi:MAG TPA: helix-turn-helix transcriptional regulator, partial [Blastocatellia bacterium]|nr:helix-turn-helix transcriptional regulator [Blastocatellia bacterium]